MATKKTPHAKRLSRRDLEAQVVRFAQKWSDAENRRTRLANAVVTMLEESGALDSLQRQIDEMDAR